MSFAAAGPELINREAMDQLLQSPSFRALANLLQDAVILIDSDENIAFINLSAEKLFGTPRGELERYPLEKLLRRSEFDMDEWLGRAAKSRIEGQIKRRDGNIGLTATRRVIPLADGGRAYVMLTLRNINMRTIGAQVSETTAPEPVNLIFSQELERQIEQAIRAHDRGVRVLILGESGVGKTAIARHIHVHSTGGNAPFIHVNCGSIPETLFESEMFGYERGAFTGALQSGKKGWVEQAAGGTLFLDEVGEIPLSSQVKLLKFLEDATIQPIGSSVIRLV